MIRYAPIAAAALWLTAELAQAQASATATVASDYDYRGISQSSRGPAFQVSTDYAFGDSGFAVGAWASNIDYGPDYDANVELDIYATYAAAINETFGWNAGIQYYAYPGSDDVDGYPEAFVGFNAGAVSFAQWYAHDYIGGSDFALYTEANYSMTLPRDLTLGFHVGYSYGDAFDDSEYLDYSLTLGYTAGRFDLALTFTGTDASGAARVREDLFNNEPRFLVSVSTTFPWATD
jgi:uncharacterized protein (TIGR02001 family)